MCGIAGIVDHAAGPRVGGRMDTMLQVLNHRGPDAGDTWAGEGVVLGHRRLKIIDITEGGAQPMKSDDGRFVITYNGEVYNYIELRDELARAGHRFRSDSDTEVLLACWQRWGEKCLDRLNGMFAFAVWDTRDRSLTIARDRLGVKPLTYTFNGSRLAFASEQKALAASGEISGGANADAIYEYLARGYTTEGRSFWDGVRVLPPGHLLKLDADGNLSERAWWSTDVDVIEDRSDEDWAERIASVLDDAVRLRLRSDVPVGAHLSGGLDSSAIVAAAARHGGSEIQTFTGAFVNDAASDEREYSRAVAEHYGLPTNEVEIDVDELAENFDRISWHMDEPIAGPGVFPQLLVCDLVRDRDVVVVLGGQGGDELFGGYLRHRVRHYQHLMSHGRPGERVGAFLELAGLAAREWRRVRRTSTRVTDGQLSPAFLAEVDPELRIDARRSVLEAPSARDLMLHDLTSYLPALLQVEDRTSMAASIESRTPILDYRLVELALSIPEHARFRRGTAKPLLRDAVGPWLPDVVTNRKDKKGFPTPLHYWKERPELNELVTRLAQPNADARIEVFSKDYLASRDEFQASELWNVLSVQGWAARHDWSAPVAGGGSARLSA